MKITKNTPLHQILKLASPCQCQSCNNGCLFGSGILIGDDLKNIAKFFKISEKEAKEKYFEEVEQFNKKFLRPKLIRNNKPYGKCIFFDGKCSIHKVKPLQCRATIQCKEYGEEISKWFMVNYLVDANDPEALRQYVIYLKTHKPITGGEIERLIKDKEKLKKILQFEVLK